MIAFVPFIVIEEVTINHIVFVQYADLEGEIIDIIVSVQSVIRGDNYNFNCWWREGVRV